MFPVVIVAVATVLLRIPEVVAFSTPEVTVTCMIVVLKMMEVVLSGIPVGWSKVSLDVLVMVSFKAADVVVLKYPVNVGDATVVFSASVVVEFIDGGVVMLK